MHVSQLPLPVAEPDASASAGLAYMAFKVIDYSVFRAAKELLYIPLSFDRRYRAKELIDVFGYRFGKGGMSLLVHPAAEVAGGDGGTEPGADRGRGGVRVGGTGGATGEAGQVARGRKSRTYLSEAAKPKGDYKQARVSRRMGRPRCLRSLPHRRAADSLANHSVMLAISKPAEDAAWRISAASWG